MIEPIDLIKKLQIEAGAKLWLINVPDAIAEAITAGGEVEISRKDMPANGAIVFCESAEDVENFSEQVSDLPKGSPVWFGFREGAGVDDTGWAPLERAGFVQGKVVELDEGWRAVRFEA